MVWIDWATVYCSNINNIQLGYYTNHIAFSLVLKNVICSFLFFTVPFIPLTSKIWFDLTEWYSSIKARDQYLSSDHLLQSQLISQVLACCPDVPQVNMSLCSCPGINHCNGSVLFHLILVINQNSLWILLFILCLRYTVFCYLCSSILAVTYEFTAKMSFWIEITVIQWWKIEWRHFWKTIRSWWKACCLNCFQVWHYCRLHERWSQSRYR